MTEDEGAQRRATIPELGEAIYDRATDTWQSVNSPLRMSGEYFATVWPAECEAESQAWFQARQGDAPVFTPAELLALLREPPG